MPIESTHPPFLPFLSKQEKRVKSLKLKPAPPLATGNKAKRKALQNGQSSTKKKNPQPQKAPNPLERQTHKLIPTNKNPSSLKANRTQ